MVSKENEDEHEAVLTAPLALEGGLAAEYRQPNVLQQVFGLFRGIRPGTDLTNFQLPPLFNMPKSQLQCYGEAVYCIGEDYLKKCARGKNKFDRFTSVVAWCISSARPLIFGLTPFNPILGETHHVSRGTLNVFVEQISHHPPVSALHATDTEENIEFIACQNPRPKFYGTGVEAVIHGKRQLKLLNFNESYEMESPNLLIKILPFPSSDWTGNVSIRCKDSGLEANVSFGESRSFFGLRGNPRSVKGKIVNSKTSKTIYEIDGQWDRVVELKDTKSGKGRVLYDAKLGITKLKTPSVKDPKGLWATESAVVWAEVSQAILKNDWGKAKEAKKNIEERERRLRRERNSRGEAWVSKHFRVATTKEGDWDCWPIERLVPPAPIAVSP
ncbi:uncharacterized protein A4U43_C05F23610 [Asparagus officinalis]|uniref:Oxysterol-binding protein n=1 Tax=Asparagus officinalis TaxID=4686 RepID=A0A5P1EU46_ASPOF|nr:oxysterol-binding protein-related protein 4C-like [Asparagus officinalis]ONK69502.1 uncharacterized protein A4U43_C05F23610 [Asparagus officinalis]